MTKLLTAILLIMLMSAGCQRMSETRYPVDWPEKKSSSNQCPDISGVYYDRSSDAYADNVGTPISGDWDSGLVTNWDVVCTVPADCYGYGFGLVCHNARQHMQYQCSLWNYFDPRASNYSPYYPERCPERKIEFSRINNLKMDIVFYENNIIFDKKSINLDGTGFRRYRCEDGSIVLNEKGSPEEISYARKEMFPTDKGSLVVKDYSKRISGLLLYPLLAPPGPTTSLWLSRWVSVDSGVNPYKDCPEAQP